MDDMDEMNSGLAHNRALRTQVIEKLVNDEYTFQDPKVTRVLLAALKDADASLIGQVRARAEDKNADANAQVAAIAAELSRQTAGRDLLAAPEEGNVIEGTATAPSVDIEELGINPDDIDEGIMEPISEPETYEQFQQRFPEDER